MNKRDRRLSSWLLLLGVAISLLMGVAVLTRDAASLKSKNNRTTILYHDSPIARSAHHDSSDGTPAPGIGEGNEQPPPSNLVVHGIVLDAEDGTAIPGATVVWGGSESGSGVPWVHDVGSTEFVASTDGSGRFVLLVDAQYGLKVVARHPKYKMAEVTIDTGGLSSPEARKAIQPITFRMKHGLSLHGRVTAKGIGPLAGVSVVAVGRGFRREPVAIAEDVVFGPGVDSALVQTDEGGLFKFECLTGGQYSLEAMVPGMLREEHPSVPVIAHAGDVTPIEIEVSPCALGWFQFVNDETGKPLASLQWVNVTYPGSHVSLQAMGWNELWTTEGVWGAQCSGLSPRSLLYVVRPAEYPLPPGSQILVSAAFAGYDEIADAPVRLWEPWCGETPAPVKIRMKPKKNLGTVVAKFEEASGHPVTNCRLVVSLGDWSGRWLQSVEVVLGDDGRARFEVPAGEYKETGNVNSGPVWETYLPIVAAGSECEWKFKLLQSYIRVSFVDEHGMRLEPADRILYAQSSGMGRVTQKNSISPAMGGPIVEGARRAIQLDHAFGEGIAQLGPYPSGTRTFEFFAPRCAPARVSVELEGGRIVDLVVTLAKSDDQDWLGMKERIVEWR